MSEGRGHSRWRNRGQAWPNPGNTWGGLLNVDGVQRRITIRREPSGALELVLSEHEAVLTERMDPVHGGQSSVPSERSEKEARLRRIAAEDVRAKYGPKAFGRKA